MAPPSDPETDAFLHLVDLLDAEANAVTHAVVRAQAALRSIIDDARLLLDGAEPDDRAWAEVGVRLMQHRAVLVDTLAAVRRTAGEDPARVQSPATVASVPVPPRSTASPRARKGAPSLSSPRPAATALVVMPLPPALRPHSR